MPEKAEIHEAAPPAEQPPAGNNDADRSGQGGNNGVVEKWCNKCSEKLDMIIADSRKDWDMERVAWEGNKDEIVKMREWLMLLATLAVSIAYGAGLNPPGGFWQDEGDGHAAGMPVLQSTNRVRYLTFYYFNAMSFVTSLVIIVLLMKKGVSVQALVFTTMFDLIGLVVAYIAGSTSDMLSSIGVIVICSATFIYFARRILLWALNSAAFGCLLGLRWCFKGLCLFVACLCAPCAPCIVLPCILCGGRK